MKKQHRTGDLPPIIRTYLHGFGVAGVIVGVLTAAILVLYAASI